MSHHDPPTALIHVGQQPYHAILLRYWREEAATAWRYWIQDLETGEQYGFADFDLLVAFLFQYVENRTQQT